MKSGVEMERRSVGRRERAGGRGLVSRLWSDVKGMDTVLDDFSWIQP